jgi:hypothetical protein
MESNEFPLTQEFVAMMLGASRPTVTIAGEHVAEGGADSVSPGPDQDH